MVARTGLFTAPGPGTPPVGTSPTDGRLVLGGVFGTTPQTVAGAGVSQSGTTMQVTVNPAVWMLPDTTNPAACFLSATDSTIVTPAAGPASGSRVDAIVVKQNNVEAGDADSRANVSLIAGVAGTPGVAPTIPPGYFEYATVTVPTGAANAAACTISGTRSTLFAPPDLVATRLAFLQLTPGTLGQMATVTSDPNPVLNGVYVCQGGTTWVPIAHGSLVWRGDSYLTASASFAAAYATIASLSVTANTAGGRVKVRVEGSLVNGNSGAARTASLKIMCDGVQVGDVSPVQNVGFVAAASVGQGFVLPVTHTPSAGAHTWTVQAVASAASSVLLGNAFLTVEEFL